MSTTDHSESEIKGTILKRLELKGKKKKKTADLAASNEFLKVLETNRGPQASGPT